ncbi:MAG: thrombospondin type 3 repeat-containing protein, partial [Phycisphaerae bacterium]
MPRTGIVFHRLSCCHLFTCLSLVLAVAGPSTARAQLAQPNQNLKQVATAALLDAHPGLRLHRIADRITRIYGLPFSSGNTPIDAAEAFRLAHSRVFGVAAADLQPRSLLADHRRTQPVMYNPQTGTYKFTIVYYTQAVEGIPVYRADLRLLARNVAGSPIVLASSALRDPGGFTIGTAMLNNLNQPAYINGRFDVAKQAAVAAVPGLLNFTSPEAVVWAGIDDMRVTPSLALSFIGDNFAPNTQSDQKWRFIVDINTGAILYRESVIIRVDGNASGNATAGLGAEQCEAEVPTAMRYLRITSGANSVFADVNGNFTITPGGGTIDATLSGQWFDTFNFLGAETSESVPAATPANLLFNSANTTEEIRAQVNGYLGANVVRDFAAFHNPAYPTFTDTGIPVTVNRTDGFCPGNAWYDPADAASPTGYSINFCQSGPSNPNTAWSSVIYHEFGHHLVEAAGSGQGQYGEGLGDVMSVIILDDNRVGLGFFGGCGAASVLRDANNTIQYPCSSEIHFCGQIFSGCIWDTRNELVITNPTTYTDILGNLAINSILLHTGSLITPQITTDFLTLDDDDGNLNNGTPHSAEIMTGFGAHNMIPATAPTNDNCADAIPIFEGLTAYDTTGATTDGPAHLAECGDLAGDGGQTYHDLWYGYTAPCSGNLTITTCEDLGGSANYDTDMVVYTWDGLSCASRAWLACNDDDPINPCGGSPNFHSTIQIAVTQGNTYLIRIGGWNNGSQGTGNLLLSNDGSPCGGCPPPTAVCQNIIRTLTGGTVTVAAADVDGGSTPGSGCTIASLQIRKTVGGTFGPSVTFDCTELGPQSVTLRITQDDGQTSECTATVTVQDVDTDGDGTGDCADNCPIDPNKTNPGQCGCGNPDTDTDGDGTADCNDGCPNDPNKTNPGVCGCGVPDTDTDGDGTPDCNDGCPADPNKTAPGQCGCGIPDTDTDGDGTADCNDNCPNDPNKINPGVCGCGVPDTDTDGDGTPDCNDNCPTDPNKINPGQCGCGNPDTDTDGDGTADCNDGCPIDPNKTAPGQCGCGTPDTDTDGDGTADCIDNCPLDPNKINPGQCGCGIPDTDTDGDGVADCIDQCPGAPDVDTDGDGVLDCNDGCPIDPNKTAPGQCGCGNPDTDTDGDGTADCVDLCPNDPNKIDPGV